MSPELIGALMIAFTGLLSGVTGVMSKRSKDKTDELDTLRRDYKFVREQLRLSDQWLFKIVRVCDQNGVALPPPPDGLQTSTPALPEVAAAHDDS